MLSVNPNRRDPPRRGGNALVDDAVVLQRYRRAGTVARSVGARAAGDGVPRLAGCGRACARHLRTGLEAAVRAAGEPAESEGDPFAGRRRGPRPAGSAATCRYAHRAHGGCGIGGADVRVRTLRRAAFPSQHAAIRGSAAASVVAPSAGGAGAATYGRDHGPRCFGRRFCAQARPTRIQRSRLESNAQEPARGHHVPWARRPRANFSGGPKSSRISCR